MIFKSYLRKGRGENRKNLYGIRRPMCWLAMGFLLSISLFLTERSWREDTREQKSGNVVLEGNVVNKQYKKSLYGAYWNITLKEVKILPQKKFLEGKYLCQIPVKKEIISYESKGDSEKLLFSSDDSLEKQQEISNGLRIGQRVRITGVFVPFEEVSNPGQFDGKKWYASLGILGQIKKGEVLQRGTDYQPVLEAMWQFRQRVHALLLEKLGEKEGSLISAMVLGQKEDLEEESKELYQRNGISHILAISGLHLTLLGMGLFRVLNFILGGRKKASFISIIFMSVYCIFTGNSVSAVRATIMFCFSLIASILGRSYDSLSALGAAAILLLFQNPYVLFNSGFWLSFLAVIGVTFLSPRLQELFGAKKKVTKSLCVSISAALATLPILLKNYGTYPWYSIILNLLILPAMSALLFLSIGLIGFTFLSVWIVNAGNTLFLKKIIDTAEMGIVWGVKLILKYYESCCLIFEKVPFQDGYLGSPHGLQIVIYAVLIMAAVGKWFRISEVVKKILIMSAIMILTLHVDFNVKITMLDVGQGDGIVIQNENGNIYLSDCGSSSVNQVGKYRLIPYLKSQGYGKIKGIFISHLDEDHMNGIIELLEEAKKEKIEISYLFLPQSILKIEKDDEILESLKILARKNKSKIVYLKQGDKIQDGKMQFLCLYPEKESYEQDRNNQSLVLSLQYRDFGMLLTGDVERAGEERIVEYIEHFGIKDNWQILKVAHHGSSGSSHKEFLEIVSPKLSLISCGKDNSYGHPHEETLEALEEVGSKVISTAESGAVIIKVGRKIKIDEFKN